MGWFGLYFVQIPVIFLDLIATTYSVTAPVPTSFLYTKNIFPLLSYLYITTKHLVSLAIRDIQVKLLWDFKLLSQNGQGQQINTQLINTVGEDAGKGDPFFTVEILHFFIHYWNQRTPQELKVDLPYAPPVPLLGICPDDLITYSTGSCSVLCITALLTMARKWKQPKSPSTGD